MNYKKAISPVVAIALLLVVSVVAVVGFQNWYSGYQSVLTTDVEQRSSNAGGSVNIEFISSEGILYVTNTNAKNVSMSTIKVGDTDCSINQELEPGVNNISIASCLSESGTNEVMLVTENGIIEEEFFLKEIDIPPPCSLLVGGEWVLVPGNHIIGTTDFCAMKYEAKYLNLVGKTQEPTFKGWRHDTSIGNMNITSSPTPEPIIFITQLEAKNLCESLGKGYHLITNAEWTTIARNIENNFENWNSSLVGVGSIYRGHSDSTPNYILNVSNELNYYDQTEQISPSIERRAHILNNKEVIWDMGGNIEEWNNDTCSTSNWDSAGYFEWDRTSSPDLSNYEKIFAGPEGDYNFNNGVGRYYGCTVDGNVFLRGGSWQGLENVGVFNLFLHRDNSHTNYYGFRCAYTLQ